MEIQFTEGNKYTVDGKEFTFSGRCLNSDRLAMQLAQSFGVLKYTENPDYSALAMALADVLLKNGCLLAVPTEYPIHAFFPQIVDAYCKYGGELEKMETARAGEEECPLMIYINLFFTKERNLELAIRLI